jgi:hypothetical protein
MLQGDDEVAAQESSRIIEDARVRHFHDPERRVGRVVAESLGARDAIAWDIYLFFAQGDEWGEEPPRPTEWMHQLSATWVDPRRLRVGEYLTEELYRTMNRLTAVT